MREDAETLMIILRLIGSWFLIAAMIAIVYDGTKSMSNPDHWVITSFVDHWRNLHPASLDALQNSTVTGLHPLVWDPLILGIMSLPGWLFTGGIGVLLYYLGRKRTRMNIYSN